MAGSIVLTALTMLYEEQGFLTPALVVNAASDPTHVLHDRLEWDDAVAGADFRLLQAASLIRSVRLRITEPTPLEVRAFVHVPGSEPGKPGTYVPERVARDDPVLREVALQEMNRRWRLLRRQYEAHREFWNLVRDDVSAAVGE